MWRAFTRAFTYGFAGRIGWDLAGWIGKWIKRLLVAGAIMAGVQCSGYVPDDIKQEQARSEYQDAEKKK